MIKQEEILTYLRRFKNKNQKQYSILKIGIFGSAVLTRYYFDYETAQI
ncbi:hypothetical protein DespoDRAFT_01474 [Desulfobacter postgatei 2ac9]|uniref:Nucleotidyltransferase n=1 Tax=Desulfobacter postgatei 2ac9 TaxID=879212 RepID=I5B1Q0_9BACT|nr:hypothetical protein DespoDRAFT_01474 [Desulfobacter postgatei 2ac9]